MANANIYIYNVNVIQYFCLYVDESSADNYAGSLEDSTSATIDPAPPLTDSGNKLATTGWTKKSRPKALLHYQ